MANARGPVLDLSSPLQEHPSRHGPATDELAVSPKLTILLGLVRIRVRFGKLEVHACRRNFASSSCVHWLDRGYPTCETHATDQSFITPKSIYGAILPWRILWRASLQSDAGPPTHGRTIQIRSFPVVLVFRIFSINYGIRTFANDQLCCSLACSRDE